MLATLMAALEGASSAGPDGARAQTVTGRLTRLDADGSAELVVGGKALALAIQPQALRQAQAALGSVITLILDRADEDAPILARITPNRSDGAARTAPASASGAAAAPPRPEGAQPQLPPSDADVLSPAARAALAQAVGRAGGAQAPIGPLFASLRGLGEPAMLATLPPPLQRAVAQALSLPLDTDAFMAAAKAAPEAAGGMLADAVARAGVSHEARLASAMPQQAALAATDLKSALTQLLSAIAALAPKTDGRPTPQHPAAGQAMPADAPPAPAAAPPHRDAAPRGQPALEPDRSLAQADLKELSATLARQAEGALERVRLLQAASLPEARPMADSPAPQQRWHVELPMMLPDGRTQMLPLRIEREAARRSAARAEGATWRVRFALDGEPLGAVAALVTWRMRQIGVTIFAEREETRRVLRAEAAELRRGLDHAGVEGIEIDITSARPAEPAATPGRLLDRVT